MIVEYAEKFNGSLMEPVEDIDAQVSCSHFPHIFLRIA